MKSPLACVVSLLTLTGAASAQSFYVDLAGDELLPSPSYGAAYGVPGHWISFPLTDGIYPLVDSSGAPTSATVELHLCGVGDSCIYNCSGSATCVSLVDDDRALLGDGWGSYCLAAPPRMTLRGLEPGTYQFFAIGYSACDTWTIVRVSVNGQQLASGGTAFTGSWEDFPVAVTTLSVSGTVVVTILNTSSGQLAGFQLVRLGPDATTFCTGSLGACPCAPGAPGNGCATSFNPLGGRLEGTGSADVASDTLVLSASGLSNSVVTFFQGETVVNGGLGTAFGDGLRCATGSVIRLASKLAVAGQATYPEAGDAPISIRGAVPAPGGLRAYQVWYRNAADFCTSSTFNLTNGVAVHWR